jgi:cell wall-associated NlpC family hydrolase
MSASKMYFDAGIIASVANTKKGFASCDAWLKYLTKNNQLVPIGQAKRGDLVFFQFDEDAQPDHVGIVKNHNTALKSIQVFEGNTSSGKAGSQSNGDGFYLKKRNYTTIMAVARPKE